MYKDFVKIWFNYYKDQTGNEYRFSKKCGMHLKQLVAYFKDADKFKTFLESITDQWVLDRLEVSIINSKLNVLVQQQTKKPKVKPRIYVTYTEEDRKAELSLSQQWRDKHPEA